MSEIFSALLLSLSTLISSIGGGIASLNSIPLQKQVAQVVNYGSGIQFTLNKENITSLLWNGTEYNYTSGGDKKLLRSINFADGTPATDLNNSCIKSATDSTITWNCNPSGRIVNLTVKFTVLENDKICVDTTIQNQSNFTISSAQIYTFGIKVAGYDVTASKTGVLTEGNPLSYTTLPSGRLGLWMSPPFQDTFVASGIGSERIENAMTISQIAGGASKTRTLCGRFTSDKTSPLASVFPESYEKYQQIYPTFLNIPDRRPIIAWWIADRGNRSETNPRGYDWNPSLDTSNIEVFKALMLSRTNTIVNQLNSLTVRPQGIIIWDLEGQEFNHATTYIGDPRVFASGYAPEMDAVVDDMFKIFKDAGYKTGITLRPQILRWVTTLPATCIYNENVYLRDQVVLVNEVYRNKFYRCLPDGKNWELMASGSGTQISFIQGQDDAILNTLIDKVEYARNRWGTTLFYIDSAVYLGGKPLNASILKSLYQRFPDSLFIPEQEYLDTLSASMPYSDSRTSVAATPREFAYTYPTSGMVIAIGDCRGTCWTDRVESFKKAVKRGDIMLYGVPNQVGSSHLSTIQSMIQQAYTEAGSVIVFDSASNKNYTFSGNTMSARIYPTKMRVYFGATEGSLSSSNLYCESGGWRGENNCNLNLTGMNIFQVRYYDFTNTLIKSEPSQSLLTKDTTTPVTPITSPSSPEKTNTERETRIFNPPILNYTETSNGISAQNTNTTLSLTLLGNNPAYILKGNQYSDPGVLVSGSTDSLFKILTSINGKLVGTINTIQIDTQTLGTSTITYSTTDSQGKTASITRDVVVYSDTLFTPPIQTTSTPFSIILPRTLSIGSKGNDVITLQQFLISKDYLPLNTTPLGYYGNETRKAVQKYQCINLSLCSGDEASTGYGMVGLKTRTLLSTGVNISGSTSFSEETRIKGLMDQITTLLKLIEELKIRIREIKK